VDPGRGVVSVAQSRCFLTVKKNGELTPGAGDVYSGDEQERAERTEEQQQVTTARLVSPLRSLFHAPSPTHTKNPPSAPVSWTGVFDSC